MISIKDKNTIKFAMSIFLMSLSLVMMVEIDLVGALGDNIIRGLGLEAWSDGEMGLHLALIYYLIPFYIGLHLSRKYAKDKINISAFKKVLLVVGLTIMLKSLIFNAAVIVKSNLDDLASIAINEEESHASFQQNKDLTEYTYEIKLKNYSSNSRRFKIKVYKPFSKDETIDNLIIVKDYDGNESIFKLNGGEERVIVIDSSEYLIEYIGMSDQYSSRGAGSNIKEVYLKSLDGSIVKVSNSNFWGKIHIEIYR